MANAAINALDGSNGLGQAEFLNLMMTQLKFQDPNNPVDNQEFIVQMAQFAALAQTQQINEGVGLLVNYQASAQAVGLLNRHITFENMDTSLSSGTVQSVKFDKEVPELSVLLGGSTTITVTTTMDKVRSIDTPNSNGSN